MLVDLQGAPAGAYRDMCRWMQRRRWTKRQVGWDNVFFHGPNSIMPELIRHPVFFWIPAFAGMTTLGTLKLQNQHIENI
jgi:hypothetical protein